VTQVQRNI